MSGRGRGRGAGGLRGRAVAAPSDPENPKRRRASNVGTELGRAKAARGKQHTFSQEEWNYLARLLASNWTKEQVAEYYFLREDMCVCNQFASFCLTPD